MFPIRFERSPICFAVLAMLAVSSCAPDQLRPAESLPPPGARAGDQSGAQTSETLAQTAERELDAADLALEAMHPDEASSHLEAARGPLADPRLEGYPEASRLRSRLAAMPDRLLDAREAAKRLDLTTRARPVRAQLENARGGLEARLAKLGEAHPGPGDFEAALQAIPPVDLALHNGLEFEAREADYSEYAGETRKAVEAARGTIARRRLEVAVAEVREELTAALAQLQQTLPPLEAAEATDPQFEEARTAAGRVDGVLQRGKALVAADLVFARDCAGVRDQVAGARATIEKRAHLVLLARQKAFVEEARRPLAEALAVLAQPDAPDPAFGAAQEAVQAVQARLEKSKELQADSETAAYVRQVERSDKEALARIEALQLQAHVAQARAGIETRRQALAEALQTVKGKAPDEEAFKQLTTAVAETDLALAAAAPLARRDERLTRYLGTVRQGLRAAKGEGDRRRGQLEVDAQVARVNDGQEALKRSLVQLHSADDVPAANAVVAELEATLEAGKGLRRDPRYARAAQTARERIVAAKKRLRERGAEIEADGQKLAVRSELEMLSRALVPLSGAHPSDEEFRTASEGVASAKRRLGEGLFLEKKVPAYRTWAAEARKRLHGAEERIAKRTQDRSTGERRGSVEQALAAVRSELQKATAAETPSPEASAALAAAKRALAAGSASERENPNYARFAATARKQLEGLAAQFEDLKAKVKFRAGALAAYEEGVKAADGARQVEPSAGKQAQLNAAVHFRSCRQQAAAEVALHPRLRAAVFLLGRERVSGAGVLTRCADLARSAESRAQAAGAMLSFYEGPARSFSKARALLGQASTGDDGTRRRVHAEALASFETCLESGRILQYKHPELRQAQLEIEGRRTTLPAVVADCQREARNLRAKNNRS